MEELDLDRVSRRQLVKAGAGLAALPAVSSAAGATEVADAFARALRGVGQGQLIARSRARTTLERTITGIGSGDYVKLGFAAGEPWIVREELTRAKRRRSRRSRSLLSFVQMTDYHLIDAETPWRGEFTEPTANRPSREAPPSRVPLDSAWRPHELLCLHVLEGMVRRINAMAVGPARGRPFDFVLSAGDAIDNAHRSEARWFIDLLDGRDTAPDENRIGKYEGVQRADNPNPSYWHPDNPERDYYGSLGFPKVPGLLEAAIRKIPAQGLKVPWFSVPGNHDTLWQGILPIEGPVESAHDAIMNLPITMKPESLPGDNDRDWRFIGNPEWVAAHFATRRFPGPVGHGYTPRNLRDGTAYFRRRLGRDVEMIFLDGVNPNGYSNGSFDEPQIAWLERMLRRVHSRYRRRDGSWARTSNRDRLVVITSHYPLYAIDNDIVGTATVERRVLGDEFEALLHRFPNIVLYIAGHTHENAIELRRGPHGGGFWAVTTSSMIDWPQQARVVELTDNRDGTLSAFLTMINHTGGPRPKGRLDVLDLGRYSRSLAYNDPQVGHEGGKNYSFTGKTRAAGSPEDRNVELIIPAPFPLRG